MLEKFPSMLDSKLSAFFSSIEETKSIIGQAPDKLSITLELPRKEIKCLLSCTTNASDVLSTPLQVITKGNEVLRPGRQRQFVDHAIDIPPSLSELVAYGAAAQLAQRHHRKRHHFHEC